MAEKKNYKCLKCKYSFSIDTKRTLKCPNCGGGPEVLREEKLGNEAQRLLDNSDSWF